MNAIFSHIANTPELRKGFEEMSGNTVEEMQTAFNNGDGKALSFFRKFGQNFMAKHPQQAKAYSQRFGLPYPFGRSR